MVDANPARLVVCAGGQVPPNCLEALKHAPEYGCGAARRFVMREWLSEEQFRSASLLWIMDDSTPWVNVHFALQSAIPLLVPESNLPLKEMCVAGGCGLYYRDAVEANCCLDVLLADETLRSRIGTSGQVYLKRSARQAFLATTA